MSAGGITEWACKEETIYGEIKETKNSSMNLKNKRGKKKKAFLTHVCICTHGWSDEHVHFWYLNFCYFSLVLPMQNIVCYRCAVRTPPLISMQV